jgi:hypothetical protein
MSLGILTMQCKTFVSMKLLTTATILSFEAFEEILSPNYEMLPNLHEIKGF